MIIQDGMRRMYAENESVFYYISLMNENYAQPRAAGRRGGGHPQGRLSAARAARRGKLRATLLGSGTILRECIAAAELLEQQFGVAADVFSITSFSELRREALECERWNLLHPARAARVPYVRTLLARARGPAGRRDRLRAQRARPDPAVGVAAPT